MIIKKFNCKNIPEFVTTLNGGQVIVLPSDTLYGFSCLALNSNAVKQIYSLKQRESNKPFIILISDIVDLQNFGIHLNGYQRSFLKANWPASLTVVFDVECEKLGYLHRGTKSLGFRIPDNQLLVDIIKQVGPITSTTVNISGFSPITSIDETIKLFGSKISLYVDNGKMESEPSTVIKLGKNGFQLLRQGKVIL